MRLKTCSKWQGIMPNQIKIDTKVISNLIDLPEELFMAKIQKNVRKYENRWKYPQNTRIYL